MQERHDFLNETIGYLPEEQRSLDTVYIILYTSFGYMLIGSIFEALFFYLYNEKFHPYEKILLLENPQPDKVPNNILYGTFDALPDDLPDNFPDDLPDDPPDGVPNIHPDLITHL